MRTGKRPAVHMPHASRNSPPLTTSPQFPALRNKRPLSRWVVVGSGVLSFLYKIILSFFDTGHGCYGLRYNHLCCTSQ